MSDCGDGLLSGEEDVGEYNLDLEEEDKLLEDDDCYDENLRNTGNEDSVLDINTDETIPDDTFEEEDESETPRRDKFTTEREVITADSSAAKFPSHKEINKTTANFGNKNVRGKFNRRIPRGGSNNFRGNNFRGNNRGNNRGHNFRPQLEKSKKVYINPSFQRRPNVWTQKPVMAIKPWSVNSNQQQQPIVQNFQIPPPQIQTEINQQQFQRQSVHQRLGYNKEVFQPPPQPQPFADHNVFIPQQPPQGQHYMQNVPYNLNQNPIVNPPTMQPLVYQQPPPSYNSNYNVGPPPSHNYMQQYQTPPPYQPQFAPPQSTYQPHFEQPQPVFQHSFEPPPMGYQPTVLKMNNYTNQVDNNSRFEFNSNSPLQVKMEVITPQNFIDNQGYNNPVDTTNENPAKNFDNKRRKFIKSSPNKKPNRNNEKINFPKRVVENSNLQVVKTVDKPTEMKQAAKLAEEDEETRLYREKIEKQKQLRESILAQKEERRKIAALKKKAEEELKLVKTPAELLEEQKKLLQKPVKNVSAVAQNKSEFLSNRKVIAKDTSLPQSTIVLIKDLAAGTTEVKLRKLCVGMGDIQKCELSPKERQATIQFKSVASAHAFFKKYQRHMLDLSMIQVELVV